MQELRTQRLHVRWLQQYWSWQRRLATKRDFLWEPLQRISEARGDAWWNEQQAHHDEVRHEGYKQKHGGKAQRGECLISEHWGLNWRQKFRDLRGPGLAERSSWIREVCRHYKVKEPTIFEPPVAAETRVQNQPRVLSKRWSSLDWGAGTRIEFCVDNELVAKQICAHACWNPLQCPEIPAIIDALVAISCSESVKPRLDHLDMVSWSPREANKGADWLASLGRQGKELCWVRSEDGGGPGRDSLRHFWCFSDASLSNGRSGLGAWVISRSETTSWKSWPLLIDPRSFLTFCLWRREPLKWVLNS